MLESSTERGICLGVVEKLSGHGYSLNERLLYLDDGILSYYSKIPSVVRSGTLNSVVMRALSLKPKVSLEAKYIKVVRPSDPELKQKKKKSYMFTIQFKESAILFKKPKKDNDVEWTFAVPDEDSYEKWITMLDHARGAESLRGLDRSVSEEIIKPPPYIPPTKRRQNVFPPVKEDNSMLESESVTERTSETEILKIKPKEDQEPEVVIKDPTPIRSNKPNLIAGKEKPPKKQKSVRILDQANGGDGAEEDLKAYEERMREKEEELNREMMKEEEKMKVEEKQKEIQQKKAEEEFLKRKEIEEKRRSERQERLKQAWEYKYNLFMDENLKAYDDIEGRIKTGFRMLQFIGNFRTQAIDLCKVIIDELPLPIAERTHGAKEFVNTTPRAFQINNIFVTITWPEREYVELSDGEEYYLYTEKMIKSINHEFRAMDMLNDTLYLLNRKLKDVIYRVPLAVSVSYKGFKCLVVSSPPVNEKTLYLGPLLSDGNYRTNKLLEDDMKFIANSLNLKEHTFMLDDRKTTINVPLSIFTEVHKVNFSGFDEEKIDKTDKSERIEGKPPLSLESKQTFSERKNPECYYFMKTADIFPVDVDLDSNKNCPFIRRLRPVFLLEYEKPLSADAFMNNQESVQNENDDVEVAQAAVHLRSIVIPAFVKKLDALEISMLDSVSLTQAFHCNGINMRYLGLVCQETNLPHVKEVCMIEMIARTVKKILRKQLCDLTLNNFQEGRIDGDMSPGKARSGLLGQFDKFAALKKDEDNSHAKNKAKNNLKSAEAEQDLADCVIELLNLVFGKGKDAVLFWTDIIIPQVLYDYNYDMKNFQKTEISLGGLLHSIVYHCNLKLKFDNTIEERLDKTIAPFAKANFEGIKPRAKIFSMHSLDVKSLSERYTQARISRDYEAAIKSCLLALNIEKLMSYKGEDYEDPTLLGSQAEILFESGEFDKAYERAEEGLRCSAPYHVEAVKSICIMMRIHLIRGENKNALEKFEQAVSYLNFHLGLYHPSHATVYSVLGSYYVEKGNFQDALLLYKTSLVCCTRILGPNHPYTGEVYLDLGNLTLKMHLQEEALNYFEKAYYVFEASKGEDSIECANTSEVMANLWKAFGKIKEAKQAISHAMSVYEKNPNDYVEKLAGCCLLLCNIGELNNDDRLVLDNANKIWYLLNKIPTKNSLYYKSTSLTLTLTALIHSLSTDKKNFLFRIFDGIVDVLGQENKLDKLNGGGEDNTLQKEYLQKLFVKSQMNKNVQTLLRDILKTLGQKLQEMDLRAFFNKEYRRNLEDLDDLQLKECLEDFEKLIFIHGIKYFNKTFGRKSYY